MKSKNLFVKAILSSSILFLFLLLALSCDEDLDGFGDEYTGCNKLEVLTKDVRLDVVVSDKNTGQRITGIPLQYKVVWNDMEVVNNHGWCERGSAILQEGTKTTDGNGTISLIIGEYVFNNDHDNIYAQITYSAPENTMYSSANSLAKFLYNNAEHMTHSVELLNNNDL